MRGVVEIWFIRLQIIVLVSDKKSTQQVNKSFEFNNVINKMAFQYVN